MGTDFDLHTKMDMASSTKKRIPVLATHEGNNFPKVQIIKCDARGGNLEEVGEVRASTGLRDSGGSRDNHLRMALDLVFLSRHHPRPYVCKDGLVAGWSMWRLG